MIRPMRQFCTFHVDGLLLGIDVQQVQEVIRYQRMTRVPLAAAAISGLINLRGQIVTAIDLRQRLGLSSRPVDALPMNVVIRTDDGAVSLLVDEIGDVTHVDEESFEPPPPTLRGGARALVTGAFKLSQQLLLVLDTAEAVNVAKQDHSKGENQP